MILVIDANEAKVIVNRSSMITKIASHHCQSDKMDRHQFPFVNVQFTQSHLIRKNNEKRTKYHETVSYIALFCFVFLL